MTTPVIEKTSIDTLTEILFEGDIKAADIKAMPGASIHHSKEELAKELLASMRRVGIIHDEQLVDLNVIQKQ